MFGWTRTKQRCMLNITPHYLQYCMSIADHKNSLNSLQTADMWICGQVKGCLQGIHLNWLLTVVGFKKKNKCCYPLDYFTTPPPAGRTHQVHQWLFIHLSALSNLYDENTLKMSNGEDHLRSKHHIQRVCHSWYAEVENVWQPFKISYPRACFRTTHEYIWLCMDLPQLCLYKDNRLFPI